MAKKPASAILRNGSGNPKTILKPLQGMLLRHAFFIYLTLHLPLGQTPKVKPPP